MSLGDILQILGFVTGLFYLWWEYNVNARLWLASIIMPAINMCVYFGKWL